MEISVVEIFKMIDKMEDHITDGPQTPEDALELRDTIRSMFDPEHNKRVKRAMSDPMECPNCKEIALYPAYYPMWECSECHREVQF